MKRHYVRIADGARFFARSLLGGQAVVSLAISDMLASGELVIAPVEHDSAHLRCVYGRKARYLVDRDKNRRDCILVLRTEKSVPPPPTARSMPVSLEASLPSPSASSLDDSSYLFVRSERRTAPAATLRASVAVESLKAAVEQLPPEVTRALLNPVRTAPTNPLALLNAVREIWSAARLSEYNPGLLRADGTLTPRLRGLLEGRVKPRELTPGEISALLGLLDAELPGRVASEGGHLAVSFRIFVDKLLAFPADTGALGALRRIVTSSSSLVMSPAENKQSTAVPGTTHDWRSPTGVEEQVIRGLASLPDSEIAMLVEAAETALPGDELFRRLQVAFNGPLAEVRAVEELTASARQALGGHLCPPPQEMENIHAVFGAPLLVRTIQHRPHALEQTLLQLIKLPPPACFAKDLVVLALLTEDPRSAARRAVVIASAASLLPAVRQQEWVRILREGILSRPANDPLVVENRWLQGDCSLDALAQGLGTWLTRAKAALEPRDEVARQAVLSHLGNEVAFEKATRPKAQDDRSRPLGTVPPEDVALEDNPNPADRQASDNLESSDPAETSRLAVLSRFEELRVAALAGSLSQMALRSSLEGAAETLSSAINSTGRWDLASMRVARDATTQVAERLTQVVANLPTEEQSQAAETEVKEAATNWFALATSMTTTHWLDSLATWEDVTRTLQYLAIPALHRVPDWFFRRYVPNEADPIECRLTIYANAKHRSVVMELVSWLNSIMDGRKDLDTVLASLEPGLGADPIDQLRSAYEETVVFAGLRKRLDAMLPRLGNWAQPLWDAAMESLRQQANEDLHPKALVESLEQLNEQLERLRVKMPLLEGEISALISKGPDLALAHRALDIIEEDCRVLGDDCSTVTTVAALHRFAQRPGPGAPSATEPVAPSILLDIGHAVSQPPDHDPSGTPVIRHARIVAAKHPEDPQLYIAAVPLTIRSNSRVLLDLEIEIEPNAFAHARAALKKLSQIEVINPEDWNKDEGRRWSYSIAIKVPLQNPSSPFSACITLKDRAREGQRLAQTELHWKDIVRGMPDSFSVNLTDTTSRQEMLSHPLGIQKSYERQLAAIQQGSSSFYIAAPRRFGKTTFLDALIQGLDGTDVVAVKVAVEEKAPLPKAFVSVCEQLAKSGRVDTRWSALSDLPLEKTFDDVRRTLFGRKKAIYLFFDEAQFLFAGQGGQARGTKLKNLLETSWGAPSPNLVPIRIGLVGQHHLPRLIQGNLDAFLAQSPLTIVARDLEPDHICRFLTGGKQGVGMQSSADARRLLAGVASNLFLLKLVVKELQSLLVEEQRTWFIKRDVQLALTRIVEEAVAGKNIAFATHVRDPLNGADVLNNWEPVRSYPVAIAWAVALASHGVANPAALRERARSKLMEWSDGRFAIPDKQLEESFAELREAAPVLDPNNGDGFRSELLEKYLARLGSLPTPLATPQDRSRLSSLALERISLPDGLEKRGSGGQAGVYTEDMGDGDMRAWRVTEPLDERGTEAFIETCAALRRLEGTRERLAGYANLPVTTQYGFLDAQPRPLGVIAYKWVPGTTLEDRVGTLQVEEIVLLGRSLARGLAVLEKRKIVHRDIRPNNVVLGPGAVPVLIDFGLARLAARDNRTRLESSPYLAPEVLVDPPQWHSPADVYSLGVLLKTLKLLGQTHAGFDRVIEAACAPIASERCTASSLAEQLDELGELLRLDRQLEDEREIWRSRLASISLPWAREVSDRFLDDITAGSLGILRFEECISIASQLLDDIFACWHRMLPPNERLDRQAHLSALDPRRDALPPTLSGMRRIEYAATGELRHGLAHRDRPFSKRRDEALKTVGKKNSTKPLEDLATVVRKAANDLQVDLGVLGIAGVIDQWLSRALRPGSFAR
jgi:hypothetical protein